LRYRTLLLLHLRLLCTLESKTWTFLDQQYRKNSSGYFCCLLLHFSSGSPNQLWLGKYCRIDLDSSDSTLRIFLLQGLLKILF